jgi:hypothetical protein
MLKNLTPRLSNGFYKTSMGSNDEILSKNAEIIELDIFGIEGG